jgi:hypothetical protein
MHKLQCPSTDWHKIRGPRTFSLTAGGTLPLMNASTATSGVWDSLTMSSSIVRHLPSLLIEHLGRPKVLSDVRRSSIAGILKNVTCYLNQALCSMLNMCWYNRSVVRLHFAVTLMRYVCVQSARWLRKGDDEIDTEGSK